MLGVLDQVGDDVVMRDQWVGMVPGLLVDYFCEGDGRVGDVYCPDVVEVMVGDRQEAVVGSPETEARLIVAVVWGEGVCRCCFKELEIICGVCDGPVSGALVDVKVRSYSDRDVDKLRNGLEI